MPFTFTFHWIEVNRESPENWFSRNIVSNDVLLEKFAKGN